MENSPSADEIAKAVAEKLKAKKIQRKPRVKPYLEVISQEKLYDMAVTLDRKDTAIIFCLYLTGCRISEALMLSSLNFYDYDKDGDLRYAVKMPTLKNRKDKNRDIPIIVRTDVERKMLNFLLDYIDDHGEQPKLWEDSRGAIYHRIEKLEFRVNATHPKTGEYFQKTQGLFPHYLRHCRVTHLYNRDKLDGEDQRVYFGWSDSRPASTYVKPSLERFR